MGIPENLDLNKIYKDFIKASLIKSISPSLKKVKQDYNNLNIERKSYDTRLVFQGVIIGLILMGISAISFWMLAESSLIILQIIGFFLGIVFSWLPIIVLISVLYAIVAPVLSRILIPSIMFLVNIVGLILFTFQIILILITRLLYRSTPNQAYRKKFKSG